MKYWRTLLVIIASLCLGFCLTPGIAIAQGVLVSIDAPDEVLEESDFIANVSVTNVEDFDSCGLDVTYDKSIITVTDVTDGQIDGHTIPVDEWHYIPVDTVDTGRIRVVIYMPGTPGPGVNGSGYIAQIHFHVLGSACETSVIHLENLGMYNYLAEEIATTTEDDSVHIFTSAPPPPVGGTVYPGNKLIILAPWIALGAAIIAGSAIFIRRRRTRS